MLRSNSAVFLYFLVHSYIAQCSHFLKVFWSSAMPELRASAQDTLRCRDRIEKLLLAQELTEILSQGLQSGKAMDLPLCLSISSIPRGKWRTANTADWRNALLQKASRKKWLLLPKMSSLAGFSTWLCNVLCWQWGGRQHEVKAKQPGRAGGVPSTLLRQHCWSMSACHLWEAAMPDSWDGWLTAHILSGNNH